MSLKVDKRINIDFQDSKYISINAKQYDRMSRFILATCYNNGVIFPLNDAFHHAYIRYRKADDFGVFNKCKVDDGKILIELTEQMLAAVGRCYADLVILENNPVETDEEPIIENTGELITKENDHILSTMVFCINVIENAFDNTEIESSYEYNALNDLMIKATEDYTYVMSACKISEDNAKESEINAKDSEDKAKESENNAAISEENAAASEAHAKESEEKAKESEINARTSETNAKASEENAAISADNAGKSEDNAKASEINASASETNAKASEEMAKVSEINAKVSETNSKTSENNAKASEENAAILATNAKESEENAKGSADKANEYTNTVLKKALEIEQYESNAEINMQIATEKAEEAHSQAVLSQSYATGGTNTRTNEDTDNAKYYYSQTKQMTDGMGGMFKPKGTIQFMELATVEKTTGYVYHIEDAFITDDTFKGGAGISYPMGTNIYYTIDGYWDCFVGEDMIIKDDGEGNIEILCSYDFITTYDEKINEMIAALQDRIQQLEAKTTLEITDAN